MQFVLAWRDVWSKPYIDTVFSFQGCAEQAFDRRTRLGEHKQAQNKSESGRRPHATRSFAGRSGVLNQHATATSSGGLN